MLNILSLGAGVQSSTLALMAAKGEVSPMPDAAIFADTQNEPTSVYLWLDWLTGKLPFPVYRATKGNLAEASTKVRRSKKSGKLYSTGLVPTFVRKLDGGKGMLQRKCTRDFKISVINNQIKELLSLKRIPSKPSGIMAVCWIGISKDEAHRMKPSRNWWIENRWPLIERNLSRLDCLRWMEEHGYPRPPRSACIFCPYHSDAEWLRLKTEEPEEFQKAVDYEKAYQAAVAADEITEGTPFLHDSLVSIGQVVFNPSSSKPDQFGNECEGMCGV